MAFFFFFELQLVLVDVTILSLNTAFPVLSCPIHREKNQILYGQNSNQAEAQSLSNLLRYATNIHHVSEDGVYYCVIPSQKWRVLPELKDIYFHYGGTQLSSSDLKNQ
jgi:hypothetical protein